jgi:hypothetical protein
MTDLTVKTGPELQALRKQAADRFTAIAMKYVPEDWTVEYHKPLSGSCWPAVKRIQAPPGDAQGALHLSARVRAWASAPRRRQRATRYGNGSRALGT